MPKKKKKKMGVVGLKVAKLGYGKRTQIYGRPVGEIFIDKHWHGTPMSLYFLFSIFARSRYIALSVH